MTIAEGKRSKLETETSTSTRSSSHDHAERAAALRRVSSTQSDPLTTGHPLDASPPAVPARIPSAPTNSSKSASPAAHSRAGFHSPHAGDQYSPLSASPRSASIHKEAFFDAYPSAVAREARGQSDANSQYPSSAYGSAQHQAPSTTPPASIYTSRYQTPIDLPSRRSGRELSRLPPLSHEETTLSSDSGQTALSVNQPPSLPPVLDSSKSMRVLPAPIPTVAASPSPLDRPPGPMASPDYRNSAPLAALLRAGELARVADDEEMEKEGFP